MYAEYTRPQLTFLALVPLLYLLNKTWNLIFYISRYSLKVFDAFFLIKLLVFISIYELTPNFFISIYELTQKFFFWNSEWTKALSYVFYFFKFFLFVPATATFITIWSIKHTFFLFSSLSHHYSSVEVNILIYW